MCNGNTLSLSVKHTESKCQSVKHTVSMSQVWIPYTVLSTVHPNDVSQCNGYTNDSICVHDGYIAQVKSKIQVVPFDAHLTCVNVEKPKDSVIQQGV